MRPRHCACVMLVAFVAFAATSATHADTIRIGVDKLIFAPAQISARIGDTIEWVSTDFIVHTATAHDKQWDVAIPAKGTGRVTLTKAGGIEYYCRYHPNMTGRISVAPK